MCVQIDDPDAHFVQAKAQGAIILQELEDEEYGSRGYTAKDPEGHQWYFGSNGPGVYWDVNPKVSHSSKMESGGWRICHHAQENV